MVHTYMDDKLSCLALALPYQNFGVFQVLVIVFFVSVFLIEVTKFKLWNVSTFLRISQVDHVYLLSSWNIQNWKSIIWQRWAFVFFLSFFPWKSLFCHFLLRCHLNFVGKPFLCWYILIWQSCFACDLQFLNIWQDMSLIMYLIGPFQNTSKHNKQRCCLNHPWVFISLFFYHWFLVNCFWKIECIEHWGFPFFLFFLFMDWSTNLI